MRSAIFITARTKSTRLPKKVLIDINGKPVIEHLIDRLKLAKFPDLIVMCTSTNPDDDVLVDIARKNGIKYFRGSEDDVLDRFSKAASAFQVDFITVTWGDELFCDPIYIDKTIELFQKTDADFIRCDELPLGTFVYGLKVEALNKVCQMKMDTDTEVWGGFFTEKGMFNVQYLKVEDAGLRHPEIRITLDYEEDLKLAREIFRQLYKNGQPIPLSSIIRLFEEHPELRDINRKCQELYEANIKRLARTLGKQEKSGKAQSLVKGKADNTR